MLLKTRFYLPPLRKKSVFRTALIDKLSHSNGGELVVVAAPAGYGKSTLLSQWLHHKAHTFAWITLDESHNSPIQFWQYVLNALHNIQPEVGSQSKTLIEKTSENSLDEIVVSLLNDLNQLIVGGDSDTAISLILDDFHLLENPFLLSLIKRFVDHLPSSIRLVIASRSSPPLSLSRLRANNQLVELRQNDLAFSAEEAEHFFHHSMDIEASEELLDTYFENTEGWIAGLQLAAISFKSGVADANQFVKNSSLDRHIEDYLFDEVFSKQSAELQHFLIRCAATKSFCAGMTNTLLGISHSQQIILTLEQANLFLIPMDNHRTWFRFHDLFRQFLLQHFHQLDGKVQAELHEKSASWYEQSGYVEDAIDHSIICHDWSRALSLIKYLIEVGDGSLDAALSAKWHSFMPKTEDGQVIELNTLLRTPTESDEQHVTLKSLPLEIGAEPLTKRELEVIEQLVKGHSNKTIAESLHISLNTLKVHIRNLYAKIGVKNRSQALVKLSES